MSCPSPSSAGAVAVTRWLRAQLFQVEAGDLRPLVGAAGGASGPGGHVAGGVTSRTWLQRGSCLAGRFEAGRRRAPGIPNSGLSLPSLPAAYMGMNTLEGDQTTA